MAVGLRNEAIKYLDQGFAIHHLIEDCPAHTVVRELTRNAVENTLLLPTPGRIEWFIEKVNGVNKLGLFNEGTAMSAGDLTRLMDLASTGKVLSVEQNFGQGGKVSGLKASPAGLVYRSCKGGAVHQITLATERRPGADHSTYVKVRVNVAAPGEPPHMDTVTDVTDRYVGRKDRPLTKDWTEVLLIGRSQDQDTVTDLLPDARGTNWLIRRINQRFYRFPKDVVVRKADITSGQKNDRNAQGLEYLTLHECRNTGRHEDVAATHPHYGPLVIRYCKLRGSAEVDNEGNSRAATMRAYGVGSRGDHICLVWKDECYDMNPGWSRMGGPFGVLFGSANIAIQILLPDDAPVKNNTYRDLILRKDDSGQEVEVGEFGELVRQSRPQWLVDYVEEQSQRNTTGNNVMERLRQFLQEMMTTGARRPVVEPSGDDQGEAPARAPGGGGGRGSASNRQTHQAARGRRTTMEADGIPLVQFTSDPGHLTDMAGRAALYRAAENIVLLNPTHFLYQEHLNRLLSEVEPDSERQQIAQRIFDDEYMVQAGRFVIQAWLFRGRAEWDETQFEEALNMGALTVYLASPDALMAASRKYNQRTNANRVPAAVT